MEGVEIDAPGAIGVNRSERQVVMREVLGSPATCAQRVRAHPGCHWPRCARAGTHGRQTTAKNFML